jgi:hypothetical protein
MYIWGYYNGMYNQQDDIRLSQQGELNHIFMAILGVGKMMIDIDRPWVNTSSYGMNINLHQFANCFCIAIWLFNIAMVNHHV